MTFRVLHVVNDLLVLFLGIKVVRPMMCPDSGWPRGRAGIYTVAWWALLAIVVVTLVVDVAGLFSR